MTDPQQVTKVTKEQLQLARCNFLDGFADVERAVISLQIRFGHKVAGDKGSSATLGQRLEALRKLKANPQFSKSKLTALALLVERLGALNVLRGDVVHARMYASPIAGETRACFINSMSVAVEFPTARLVTLEQFNKLSKELGEIASSLDKI